MADQPPRYDHPVLGRFDEWDQVPGFWQGKARWLGTLIDLDLQVHDGTVDQAAGHAARLLDRAAEADAEMAQEKVRDLYPVWQENWHVGEDLSPQEWLARQEPRTLSVHDNGAFEFYWADGGLFLNHEVQVRWREGTGYFDATIVG